MSPEMYAAKYDELLDFMYQVINSLKSKPENDYRMLVLEHLAQKLFLHSVTVRHLRSGSNVRLRAYPQGANVIDFASLVVIARAIFETYLNMFEIFFEPNSADVFTYRRSVYRLSGIFVAMMGTEAQLRANPNNPHALHDKQVFDQQIGSLHQEIKSTHHFKNLNTPQQDDSLYGKIRPKRSYSERAVAAGFGKNFIDRMYNYMSSFTHGDELSALQTTSAQSDQDKDLYFIQYMGLIMMINALVIKHYSEKFAEAQVICDRSKDQMDLVNLLLEEVQATQFIP